MCLVKYLLFTFNSLCFCGGAVILGLGIWLAVDTESIPNLLNVLRSINNEAADQTGHILNPNAITLTSYILIAAGAAIVVISFLGCCGAFLGNKILLTLYSVCLLLVLGLEIGAAVFAYVSREKFENSTRELMLRSIQDYYGVHDGRETVTRSWDAVQQEFQCCAVNDYRDFDSSKFRQRTEESFPASCCNNPRDYKECRSSPDRNSYYSTGCFIKIRAWIKTHLSIIGGVSVAVCVMQVFGIVCSLWMCCSLSPFK